MSDEVSGRHLGVGPTDAEIEAWATREHRRREQWAHGPTLEQAALSAMRERDQRRNARQLVPPRGSPPQRKLREIQFAGMGALRMVLHTSVRDAFEYLVQAGLAWEEETSPPGGPMSRETP